MPKKKVITFPRWGNYTIAFKSLFEMLGMEVVCPPKTTSETIQKGARISPEMYCLPLKVNMGNYLEAIEKGADTIFMVTSLGGSCRLRYYAPVQDKVLKENGYDLGFVIFDQNIFDVYLKIKKISGASLWQILRAIRFFYQKLRLIENLEKRAQYLRPREIEKGKTDKILNEIFSRLEKIKNESDLKRFRKESLKRMSAVMIEKKKEVPKIGIIGEIYTVCEPAVNFDIEKKLGREGVEVHRQMDISYHLKKKIFPWKDWIIQKGIKPYLRSTVGGHGRDAIYEMLKYLKKGFDGIIHILPAMCMPEVTVRPILHRIHLESGIPFMSLSLDEQVGEAGIDTRVEAFVDVVRNYYKMKNLKLTKNSH